VSVCHIEARVRVSRKLVFCCREKIHEQLWLLALGETASAEFARNGFFHELGSDARVARGIRAELIHEGISVELRKIRRGRHLARNPRTRLASRKAQRRDDKQGPPVPRRT
jgi:hypothetical protein